MFPGPLDAGSDDSDLPTLADLRHALEDGNIAELIESVDDLTLSLQFDDNKRQQFFAADTLHDMLAFLVESLQSFGEEEDDGASSIIGLLIVLAQNGPPDTFWPSLLNSNFARILLDRWFTDEVSTFFVAHLMRQKSLYARIRAEGHIQLFFDSMENAEMTVSTAQLIHHTIRSATCIREYDDIAHRMLSLSLFVISTMTPDISSTATHNTGGLQLIDPRRHSIDAIKAFAERKAMYYLALACDNPDPRTIRYLDELTDLVTTRVESLENDQGRREQQKERLVRMEGAVRLCALVLDRIPITDSTRAAHERMLGLVERAVRTYKQSLFGTVERWDWLRFQVYALGCSVYHRHTADYGRVSRLAADLAAKLTTSLQRPTVVSAASASESAPGQSSSSSAAAAPTDDGAKAKVEREPHLLALVLTTDLIWARRLWQATDGQTAIPADSQTIQHLARELIRVIARLISERPVTPFLALLDTQQEEPPLPQADTDTPQEASPQATQLTLSDDDSDGPDAEEDEADEDVPEETHNQPEEGSSQEGEGDSSEDGKDEGDAPAAAAAAAAAPPQPTDATADESDEDEDEAHTYRVPKAVLFPHSAIPPPVSHNANNPPPAPAMSRHAAAAAGRSRSSVKVKMAYPFTHDRRVLLLEALCAAPAACLAPILATEQQPPAASSSAAAAGGDHVNGTSEVFVFRAGESEGEGEKATAGVPAAVKGNKAKALALGWRTDHPICSVRERLRRLIEFTLTSQGIFTSNKWFAALRQRDQRVALTVCRSLAFPHGIVERVLALLYGHIAASSVLATSKAIVDSPPLLRADDEADELLELSPYINEFAGES
ncbi:unnamed protein product [Vitrella brassicaformis CCMP3155]|uniref:Uncharacterized protein n=3 Tax=Vitrella brassicaformis TaxID=1169539 RepID=A0A0G4ERE0_VITBC|nr:unnamed protein product [Vitrella brassicaformis CCMP3155]|eukprot:CEL99857.1 unnamed protein product [Vitrella brassicaformis CCMP3155]